MPQWLSALTAETYMFLSETGFGDAYREAAESILQSNLCVFFPDGFASAGYLVPYKVVQFTSDPSYKNDCLIPGTAYGHSYDSYANDQDWALYYIMKLHSRRNTTVTISSRKCAISSAIPQRWTSRLHILRCLLRTSMNCFPVIGRRIIMMLLHGTQRTKNHGRKRSRGLWNNMRNSNHK